MRIGYPSDADLDELSDSYRAAFEQLLSALSDAGAELRQFAICGEHAQDVYRPIQMIEARHQHTHVLGTFPDHRDDYGPDVRARLDLSADVTLADYLDATLARQLLTRQVEAELESGAALLTPVSSGSPSRVSSPDVVEHRGRQLEFRRVVLGNTVVQNLAGLPAATVPGGVDEFGVPISFQLSAARGAEADVTALASLVVRLQAEQGVARPVPRVAAFESPSS
jgi:Asp-tRNA(Asn)/Glu-tRNA(Gln) amidotransferase A subunit family amidase